MKDVLNRWEAAKYIASKLGKDPQYWYGYLRSNTNARSRALKEHRYKISVHVLDGELAYTRFSLQEFVRVNLTIHSKN
ncbi:hypothetical protein F942_00135 [Acinetobacter ursingii ANC 3649]|uniref:Uncharacterized protein n=1 Tax=Acinetobacter ursingii ANC 3649 TaxID=1257043 RepID=N9DEB1_9GAMM|nr:hypothetical protein F942_00135 [Acinetobacter ursingii ANC 3649]PMC96186.1 hypothetical protein CJ183_13410 [Acinetobacter ursingii]PZT87557.1 MAG: hypothetical protein DI627_06920 [Acinetobacter sp.]